MIDVRSVAEVRAAEDVAFLSVPEGTLMQRAAHGLAAACVRLLTDLAGGCVGSRIVLLVGSGNNGGDALWAGAILARRGCRVDAVCLSDRVHEEGLQALQRAGGRTHRWDDTDPAHLRLLVEADVVIDGILGIGGSGGLRPDAAEIAEILRETETIVVAVDVPSGIDADTGAVAGVAISADVTVTFGAVKAGLLVAPGRHHSGAVQVVDIGLEFGDDPLARVLEGVDVAAWIPEPDAGDHKYRRGVVGVAAGSPAYPGAALLTVAGARHANVGMVRYLDRGDACPHHVIAAYPDVVVDGSPALEQTRATAWACGPGFTGDQVDVLTVEAVLAAPVPVVLDAGALAVVVSSAQVRAQIAQRSAAGLVTVLTPHDGEFERLLPGVLASSAGRLDAARAGANALNAVILLKGPGTVVADAHGAAFLDTEGTADLGTAGSGDVLTGLIAGLLAGAWAAGHRDPSALVEPVAAAVWLHGRAGRCAAVSAPVTAPDIAAALPPAMHAARFGAAS